ncbi:MAG: hypothetical protein O2839_06055 [Cyanobacteria bacterium]|nr:hypothetical protein [Cyanobacteriota bacterium]MDA1246560.1 hypothetical protein [Cyanobacteriota bacterium]
MTDSAILLKPVTLKFLGPFLGAVLLLVSCAGEKPPQASSQPAPGAPAPASVLIRAPAAPLAGLTPLPSSNQVIASVSSGRVDPFAPLQKQSPLSLPPGLIFNGVIRSGGIPEALVQFGAESGTLRVGQRGGSCATAGCSTPLLPAGWSVASIDVQKGRLTLLQGKQRVTAEL